MSILAQHSPALRTLDRATLLEVDNLSVGYRMGHEIRPAVQGVSFSVAPGQVLALVGESGSGKTTTGHAILGLLPGNGRVLGGRISLGDQVLTDLRPKAWRTVRGRAVTLIPQDPTVSLDPTRRVGHQVQDTLRLHTDLTAAQRRGRVLELFDLVGFRDPVRTSRQYPHELSGGMRQRVLIASAVATQPQLIIADEPTSGLDATVQKQVLDLLDELRTRSGLAVVLVTHDLGVAADRSDRIGVMQQGRLVEIGDTAEVIASPAHAYTQRLLASVPGRSGPPGRLAVTDRPVATDRSDGTGSPGTAAVEVVDLVKRYGDVAAVDGVSFTVPAGRTFSLVGESGSGKSTTARVLTGLTSATTGSVRLLGTDITTLDRRGFRPLRRDVQIVYQNPYSSFDPRFDVHDVVDEPLRSLDPHRRSWRRRRAAVDDRVVQALEAAALPADVVRRHPRELSGGQRQRVAIARALVLQPRVLVLDEPISALDVSVAAQILELLQNLQRDRGLTYVFISHDLAVVREISDRVAVMRHGRIVEQGPVDDVFGRPAEQYTVDLLQAIAGRTAWAGAR